MITMETIRARHSVRRYLDRPIEGDTLKGLEGEIARVAAESGLDIRLVLENPEAFDVVANFGVIKGCSSCIAFIARGDEDDEAIGYWGQQVVLFAQDLGLNTCWALLCARKKIKVDVPEGKRVRLVIAVGYGKFPGKPRPTKGLDELCSVECGGGDATLPDWFSYAMEAAQLAPTGMNRQDFHVALLPGNTVRLDARPGGLRSIDKGIVRRNFEIAANETGADWRFAND